MKPSDLTFIKRTNTLKLSRGQLFAHYAVVLILLISPLMTAYSLFQIYITNTYSGVRSAQELMITGFPWILPALLLYLIQKRRLKFKIYNTVVSRELFKKTVLQTAGELNWTIENLTNNYMVAVSGLRGGSRGELITIIRNDKKILVNSICDPDNIMISVASWGNNRKNVRSFIVNLENMLRENNGYYENT